jgi:hypothetical protein
VWSSSGASRMWIAVSRSEVQLGQVMSESFGGEAAVSARCPQAIGASARQTHGPDGPLRHHPDGLVDRLERPR